MHNPFISLLDLVHSRSNSTNVLQSLVVGTFEPVCGDVEEEDGVVGDVLSFGWDKKSEKRVLLWV